MKIQKDQNLNETALTIQQSSIKKCIKANPASHVCYDKKCNKMAYICGVKQCKCYQEHYTCPQILIQSIMNRIQSKIIPFQKIQKQIIEKIDKTIDELCQLKLKLQTQIKLDLALYGLTINDKNLLQAFDKQNITGKQFFKAFNQAINIQGVKIVQKNSVSMEFSDLWKFVDEEINKKSNSFFEFLDKCKNNLVKQYKGIQIFKDSKIVQQKVNQQNLIKMFKDNIPRSAKLLYRASQQNFKADKFHEKCDNIPHTITLCKTVYDKVIGGYTPLSWDKSKREHVKDQSGRSFVFSLTNNDKFCLQEKQYAIYQRIDCGPIFGNDDFFISQSANTSANNSATQLNTSYYNSNYVSGNGDSFMKFTGNPDKKAGYKPQEWQVWQLEFISD